MTDWLTKTFIKRYQQIEDVKVRTAYGRLSGMVGIVCNILLFAVKLIVGLLMNSISVMADSFNNLSDAASSVIGYVGMRMAGKPADDDHPFGHGRIEYIAAFIVAFIVIQVGFSLFKTSLGKIRDPEEMTFSMISLLILLLSIGIKMWMFTFNRKLGKRIQSKVMLATAVDSLGDMVTTSATVLSIAVFGIWGVNVDGIIGLIVSVVVMIAGVNIARDTLAPLIGEAIDPKVYKSITEFVEGYEGIVGTHDLIVHNYGPAKSMASIHAEVSNNADVQVSHEIIDRIERECIRMMGIFLVIHMDPVDVANTKAIELKKIVGEIVTNLDSRLKFHDFRMVDGSNRTNLIFDLVVPREYNTHLRDTIRLKISDSVQEKYPGCYCVITMENSFCTESLEED